MDEKLLYTRDVEEDILIIMKEISVRLERATHNMLAFEKTLKRLEDKIDIVITNSFKNDQIPED